MLRFVLPATYPSLSENQTSLLDKVVAAVTPSKTDGEIDAIDVLKKDHDDVDALFKDYQTLAEGDGDAGDRRQLSTQICGMLAVHAMIEEEIFVRRSTGCPRRAFLAHFGHPGDPNEHKYFVLHGPANIQRLGRWRHRV